MTLALQVFDTPDKGELLADFTSRLHPQVGGSGLRFSTNKHGFAALEAPLVPLPLSEAFRVYDWPGTPYVVVSNEAGTRAWGGRLEDVAIVPGGVRLGALGYWRALLDVPYTALWSDTSTARWELMTQEDQGARFPDRYETDNNRRLYMALKLDETYGSGNHICSWYYERPHNSNRSTALVISFDFDVTLPTDWLLRTRSFDSGFGGGTSEQTVVTGDGTNQTGSHSETITSGKEIVVIEIVNNTGGNYTSTADTGDWFARITGIRMKSKSATVLASDIATHLVSFINGVNSDQLSSSDVLIEATTTDLEDEIYEDQLPGDILDRLALLHNFEVGVWEDRLLHFRERDTENRHWYVDVTRIVNLERSLEEIRNSAYATYRDANGRKLRTSVANNTESQDRFDLIRRGFVNVQTTSQTEAETHRDAFLTDRADFAVRAEIEFVRLYDQGGAEYPLYMMRAGDRVTMRNLPPNISTDIDEIRTFLAGRTEYDALNDELALEPRTPTPTLVNLVAKRRAGIR